MSEAEIDRAEFWVTANREVRLSNHHNFQDRKINVNTNWDLDKFEEWLEGYHDKEIVNYLRFGWPLNTEGAERRDTIPPNQNGAQCNKEELRKYIKAKIQSGSVIGPFFKNPFRRYARISLFDTRPKKDSDEL